MVLTNHFQSLVDQYVNQCSEDFKELIQHHDKRERDVAEAALFRSEERYKELYENSPVMMQSIDRNGILISVNKKWLEVLKYARKDVIGQKSVKFLTESSRKYAEKTVQPEFFETGDCVNIPYQYLTKNGDVIDVKLSATSGRNDDGDIIESRAVLVDETKQNWAEAALSESENRFKELYEKSAEGLQNLFHNVDTCVATLKAIDDGQDFVYTNYNPAAERADNVKKEEIIGRRISKVFPCVKDVGILDAYKRVWKTGQSEYHPISLYRSSRAERWQKHFLCKLSSGEVVAIFDDLTELKKAETDLLNSKSQLLDIFTSSPEMLIIVDDQMKILLFNNEAERATGYNLDEVLGRHFDFLIPDRFRKEHIKNVNKFNRSSKSSLHMDQRGDILCLRKDGSEFPALASVSKRKINQKKRLIIVLRDITDRRNAEEGWRQALIKSEAANKAKSNFLAAMSHDLRTPLNAILGFSEVLNREMFGPLGSEKYKDYAMDIHNSGQLLLALVNDILDVSTIDSGKRPLNKEPIILKDLLDEGIKTVSKFANDKGVSVSLCLQDKLPLLTADKRSITQIVHNLLSNAIKFTNPDGEVSVSAKADAEQIVIAVKDTGIGIPEDRITEIMEPFSQVITNPHNAQEGTGLGLSIVKSLVEMHDGNINVQSKIGEGSTMTVSFSRVQQAEIWPNYT